MCWSSSDKHLQGTNVLSFTTFQLFRFYETPGNLHKLTVIFRLQLLATTALPAQVPCLQDGVIWESWEMQGRGKCRLFHQPWECNSKKLNFTSQLAWRRCKTPHRLSCLVPREKQVLRRLSFLMVREVAELPLESGSVWMHHLWHQQTLRLYSLKYEFARSLLQPSMGQSKHACCVHPPDTVKRTSWL